MCCSLRRGRRLGISFEHQHLLATAASQVVFQAFASQLVDGALGALHTPPKQMPLRIFTPQVLAHTGAKLSKSLLREHGCGVLTADVEPWMLDTTTWPGSTDNYVDALLWLVGALRGDPKHFFRSFTVKELGRLMTARPADLAARPRAHEMGIYKRYFDLIAAGAKTTEIRVNDSSRAKLTVGSLIRAPCGLRDAGMARRGRGNPAMVTTGCGLTSLTVTFGGACRRGPHCFAVRKASQLNESSCVASLLGQPSGSSDPSRSLGAGGLRVLPSR